MTVQFTVGAVREAAAAALDGIELYDDPGFSERALGFRSFTDFIKAHPKVAEIDETENIVQIRLAAGTR